MSRLKFNEVLANGNAFFPRFDAIKIILALKIFCPRLNADKMSSLNSNVSS